MLPTDLLLEIIKSSSVSDLFTLLLTNKQYYQLFNICRRRALLNYKLNHSLDIGELIAFSLLSRKEKILLAIKQDSVSSYNRWKTYRLLDFSMHHVVHNNAYNICKHVFSEGKAVQERSLLRYIVLTKKYTMFIFTKRYYIYSLVKICHNRYRKLPKPREYDSLMLNDIFYINQRLASRMILRGVAVMEHILADPKINYLGREALDIIFREKRLLNTEALWALGGENLKRYNHNIIISLEDQETYERIII